MISTGSARPFYCLARANLLDAADSLTLHHQRAFETSINFHSQSSKIPYSPIRKPTGPSARVFPVFSTAISHSIAPSPTQTSSIFDLKRTNSHSNPYEIVIIGKQRRSGRELIGNTDLPGENLVWLALWRILWNCRRRGRP